VDIILNALKQIKEQGSFCGKRTIAIDKLQIEIKGFGALKLPLAVRHVKALTKLAKPAKFGIP